MYLPKKQYKSLITKINSVKLFTNKTNTNENRTRSFGFKEVNWSEHQKMVNQVFTSVANKYDLMNDVMSFGIHRLWKREFVDMIGYIRSNIKKNEDGKNEYFPMKIIDVAGGTGDISFKILDKAEEYHKRYLDIFPVEIKVLDINRSMLEEGRIRAEKMGISPERLSFFESNAEDLSIIEDSSIDLYTISFGIRNCTNREKVLKEAFRVLKKGGRFMCMEFSHVNLPVFSHVYDWYSVNIIPNLGNFIMNDKDSYQYLVESIRRFPNQEDFLVEIKNGGFSFGNYTNLSGGIVAIHSGIKI